MTTTNMTCDAFDAALPDYLEGTLDDSMRASVGRHLSECVRCASVLRDIDNIREEASALPELVPSRDLWQGIEARIAAPVIPFASRPQRQRRFAPAWMGVAAAALIVSTAGITYMLTARSLQSTPNAKLAQTTPDVRQVQSSGGSDSGSAETSSAPPPLDVGGTSVERRGAVSRLATEDGAGRSGTVPAVMASRSEQTERAYSDLVYGKEIEMLQRVVSQRKTMLDSSTVAIIEKNLQIIDAAIEQSRAALARDPASRLLDQQLTHALDKKVELLRTAAMLPAST